METACSCGMGKTSWKWQSLRSGSAQSAEGSATAATTGYGKAGLPLAPSTGVPLLKVTPSSCVCMHTRCVQ